MVKRKQKTNLKGLVVVVLALLLAGLTGAVININIEPTTDEYTAEIEYSEEQVPAEITNETDVEQVESGQGGATLDGEAIPTVESVESNGPVEEVGDEECPEGEECGRGAAYPKIDVSSPQAFANATIGQCINVDGHYGAQCWDSMSAFFYNYAHRVLSTCGTGAAKGTIANGCWQKNAGNEFTMVWDKTHIQAGDIVVFSTGEWGHIGMAMGEYNKGYVSLLGQNQGGKACPGGGAAGNIINLSLRDFMGAFRPKAYIKPEPKPEPKPTPTPAPVVDKCKVRKVVKGDTMGKIMKECEGKITWGQAMNDYASHWYSTTFKKYLTVYDGWSSRNGVGLFSGDTIEFRK